ncbi:hypothetical protein P3J6_120107 [Pseudoalteromonas sp. 3J6]|nr:hypothetical protein P3J6_120107 [Pseudoalteromonas sp. 3J6]
MRILIELKCFNPKNYNLAEGDSKCKGAITETKRVSFNGSLIL